MGKWLYGEHRDWVKESRNFAYEMGAKGHSASDRTLLMGVRKGLHLSETQRQNKTCSIPHVMAGTFRKDSA